MTNPVRVSDHALIRFMQRVLDIDVEQLRGLMADGLGRHQGAPCVRTIGARFLLVNGVVVTVIKGDVIPSHEMLVGLSRRAADEEPA